MRRLEKCLWTIGVLVLVAAGNLVAGPLCLSVDGGGGQATFSGTLVEVPGNILRAAGLPDGSVTLDARVTTTNDILLFDSRLRVTKGTWYNTPAAKLGSDTNPPQPALLSAFPELGIDSWVTTPNLGTSSAGPNKLDASGSTVTHFDTTRDGPQTDFQFGQITLVPDSAGEIAFAFSGTLQTASKPHNPVVVDDFFYATSASCVTGSSFEAILERNGATDFLSTYGNDPSIVESNSTDRFRRGVTMFVPTNSALAEFSGSLDVRDLIVADSSFSVNPYTNMGTGDSGWDSRVLESLVRGGGEVSLLPLSGRAFPLEGDNLKYGGANILDSFQAGNGWVHVVDAVPVTVPEPGSSAMAMIAGVFACLIARKRRVR